MRTKKPVSFIENEEGTKFLYLDVGHEDHGRHSFRLWISSKLVKQKDGRYFIEFPIVNARIFRTERGNLVLKPANDCMVYDIFIPCGYRGYSEFEILSDHYELYGYYEYESPRGSLGISRGALVNAPIAPIKIKWKRSGRLYGSPPEGITIILPTGETKQFDYLPDGLEALEELKELV